MTPNDKGKHLLDFLKATAVIRRRRITKYGDNDQVVWLGDLPKDRPECRSPFANDKDEFGGLWLEVRKQRMPVRPPVPKEVLDWVRDEGLDQVVREPELLPEITVLVERVVPDPVAPEGSGKTVTEQVPEVRRLEDYPNVEENWLEYLVEKWEPWAQAMRRWQEVQNIYEKLDFMRRRLEEAEERYELVLAVGYLQWHDPTGVSVARHLLTAPAEIALDAARGVLSVAPAASFDGFRVELDMLDLQHRPRLRHDQLGKRLDELDIQAWDFSLVAPALREIANSLSADAEVEEEPRGVGRFGQRPRISFAPALVLRERRPTGYDDLVGKFIRAAEERLEGTTPWLRLLQEGENSPDGPSGASTTSTDSPIDGGSYQRFLFPLPTNEEQRKIAALLNSEACVLVKGPPGTGKSHTIANLISHLLANGDRVLVTAQAPKALTVLRNLLPEGIRDLCVTALGSSREDQRLLEESVRGIIRRKSEWQGPQVAQHKIEEAESQLQELEAKLARIERDLREFREAETYSHELPGGYSGTAAQIARRVRDLEREFGWFPETSEDAQYPLDLEDSLFLVEAHASFTSDLRAELALDIGNVELKSPEEFQGLVERLRTAEDTARRANAGADAAKRDFLEPIGTEELRMLRSTMRELTELSLRTGRILGGKLEDILHDLLVAADSKWVRLAVESRELLRDVDDQLRALGPVRVELPSDVAEDRLRADVERRLAHFESGGRKGIAFLAPQVVRETAYIAEGCRVDGHKADEVSRLRCLRDYLDMRRRVRELRRLWAEFNPEGFGLEQTVDSVGDLTSALEGLLEFFNTGFVQSLSSVLGQYRTDLQSTEGRQEWSRAIDALIASREELDLRSELERLVEDVRGVRLTGRAHPVLGHLEQAAERRDPVAWRASWQDRERIRQEKSRLERYEELLKKLDDSCTGLGDLLRTTAGTAEWGPRIRRLREAWYWAAARSWVRRISDASAYEATVREYHKLKRQIEKATENLVSLRAWKAFFDRLDETTTQSLNAWTRAISRVGKGTGIHANRHRRTARKYLMDCVPRIPAWVMPLHRLWDSVEAVPGLFDTVIVDEASQAGVDSLLLFLLAKRIIVVGDDKQNSPEAVGVQEDDIARLAREHLASFRFSAEYRPDTSLFDHAERTFGSHVTLREHFRCVPEIIRFSNALCYRDTPLIPLRQPPPGRLPPLRSVFVAEGACEGNHARILNRAEAEALVDTIARLVEDPAYRGKSMGVIALQGHAQAQEIERLLARRLDPKVIEERRLRCGEPATFQGDQRDVMFLSLVIAPNVNFRALNRLPDQRRFNVAMSRARDQVWLFHSVRLSDLSPEDLRYRLIQFFERPGDAALEEVYEDRERLEREAMGYRSLGSQPSPYESWFEVDVALELMRRNYRVRPQVDVAGRRIDLVVEGLNARLAVECDGDAWHGPEEYERDMARQRQLERSGWTFVRIRESEFYLDRQRAVDRIVETCERLGIKPVGFVDDHPEKLAGTLPHELSWTAPPEQLGPADGNDGEIELDDDTEQEAEESEVSSPTDGPFTGFSKALGFPDPREASLAEVREALRQIIEREGPLSKKGLYRLYIEGCPGLHRASSTVRQRINRAIQALIRTGEVILEDELQDRSFEGQVLRLVGTPPVVVRPRGNRDLREIPPSELIEVLRKLYPAGRLGSHDSEALCRALLEHYGFSRLTSPRRAYLSKVLTLL